MKIIRRVFDFKGSPILFTTFAVLFVLEGRRQLRKRKQSKHDRMVINAIMAIPSFGLLRFAFLPAIVLIAKKNKQWKLGLNYQLNVPAPANAILAFLIMDYTNYVWHILNHRLPFLWRFHLVHHTDLDLDVTTAVRFHFGELIGSVFFRGAFVLLAGATMLQVLVYEILFEMATQFHHSNMKLPLNVEKKLNALFVTPRMHGIHHSNVKNEADSNYSVIFSLWDRLHHTMCLNVPQGKLNIGVPSYADAKELTVKNLLKLPFTKIRAWETLPSNAVAVNQTEMLP